MKKRSAACRLAVTDIRRTAEVATSRVFSGTKRFAVGFYVLRVVQWHRWDLKAL